MTDTQEQDFANDQELAAAFSFNPFPSQDGPAAADELPPATDAAAATGSEAAPAAPAVETPPAQPPATASTDGGSIAPQPVTVKSEAELEKERLIENNRLLQQALDLATKSSASAPAEQPATPAKPVDETPEYAFTLPPQLTAALDSEDPAERHGAIGAVMTGVARSVHRTVAEDSRKQMTQLIERLPALIQHVVKTSQRTEEIRKDFYGKYRDLDAPQLHPIVQQTAELVMKELNVADYTPEVAEKTAARLYGMLGKQLPGTQPQAPVPAAPPPFLGGSSRPAAPASGDKVADDIFDTLNN